ncbi:D-aminoacyl-tRNA deacylase 1 isoform X2 [Cydia pomonella]|uniref:D-aminoacyl-tRNA deacylase 1 isoform X2 n=1 Tax=Cydia pomonella TaxID=82600 RepID=UPI002ADDC588|nr:D-aminoacyl-tRNA deacylase 1 isoform X2 [Cydia pomonella]
MKALIQRVMKAKVTVNGEVVSNIEQGLCVLIGISKNDNLMDMEYIDKRWSKSVVDKDYEVLCVSQFTLYNTWKGNKPDFHNAMPADESKKIYEQFLELLKKSYKPEKIKDGVFGAYMQVSIENDGPVTVSIESPVRDEKTLAKENSRNPQRVKMNINCDGDLHS